MVDIIFLFLLNLVLFMIFALVLARRFDRQYNSRTFLRNMEQETRSIMTAFNENADTQLRILEDRIETLGRLRDEADGLVKKLAWLKGDSLDSLDLSRLGEESGTTGLESAPRADKAVQAPSETERNPDPAPTMVLEPGDRRQQVASLFRQGFTPEDISHATGVPLGEVELIIRFMVRT